MSGNVKQQGERRKRLRNSQTSLIIQPIVEVAVSTVNIEGKRRYLRSNSSTLSLTNTTTIDTSLSFSSCLNETDNKPVLMSPISGPQMEHKDYFHEISPRSIPAIVLKRALSINEVGDESWLSSSFIDLVFSKFAKHYTNISYLSIDFAAYIVSSSTSNTERITDINGCYINYDDQTKPLVFILNAHKIHWNLIRVIRYPEPELQLFEPMGMPHNRHGGLNFRNIPKSVIEWFDSKFPLPDRKSWISLGSSAIVNQQQMTSYDCGVACLLYAEKCGQGQRKDTINDSTTQQDITEYRKILQAYMQRINRTFDI
eukprot:gene12385-16613_t